MIRVLFYSDAREYGGHEAMTVAAVGFLAGRPDIDVSFVFHKGNKRLSHELHRIRNIGHIRLCPLPLKSEGFKPLRPVVQILRVPRLHRLLKSLAPDVVVVIQGNIEMGWLGLVVANRIGLRTISYIPMAHRLDTCFSLVTNCRDFLDKKLYRLPDKFVTISESAKRMLRERGTKAQIEVVPNGIDFKYSAVKRADARRALGIPERDYVVAVIGRITFSQKAQDFFVDAIARHRGQLNGFRFCIVGEGPDEQKLRTMIGNLKLGDCFSILPWQNDLSSLYSAIDLVVIPSKFEGVPLVMLEAMWYGLPIVASDVDGMAEVLPSAWLFRRGDPESLVNTLQRVQLADNSRHVAAQKSRVTEEFTVTKFQRQFCQAVTGNQQVTANSHSVNAERVTRLAYRN